MVSLSEAQIYNAGADQVLVRNLQRFAKESFSLSELEGFMELLKNGDGFTKADMSKIDGYRSKLEAHFRFIENATTEKEIAANETQPFPNGCFVPVPLRDEILSDEEAYNIFRSDFSPGLIAPLHESLVKHAIRDEAASSVAPLASELVGVNER